MMVRLYKDADWYSLLIFDYAEQYLIKKNILKQEIPMSFKNFIRKNLRSSSDFSYKIDKFMQNRVETSCFIGTKYEICEGKYLIESRISNYLEREIVIIDNDFIIDKNLFEAYGVDSVDYLSSKQIISNKLIFDKEINILHGEYYDLDKHEYLTGEYIPDDYSDDGGISAQLYYSILKDMKTVNDIKNIIKETEDIIDKGDCLFKKTDMYAEYFTYQEVVDFIKSENIMNEELLRRYYREKDLDKNINKLINFYNIEIWR